MKKREGEGHTVEEEGQEEEAEGLEGEERVSEGSRSGSGGEEREEGQCEQREATSVRMYVLMQWSLLGLVRRQARLATYPKEVCNGGHMVDTSAFH